MRIGNIRLCPVCLDEGNPVVLRRRLLDWYCDECGHSEK